MALFKIRLLIFLILFPIFMECIPELRTKVTHIEYPNKSNFSIPILNTTKAPSKYTTFVIDNPSNKSSTSLKEQSASEAKSENSTKLSLTSTPNLKPENVLSGETEQTPNFAFPFPMIIQNISTLSKTAMPQDSNDDVEEIFTYQVKKQNRNKFFSDQDILKKSELIQLLRGQSQSEDKESKRVDNNNELKSLESRILSLVERLASLESNVINSSSSTNETIKALQAKVVSMNENYRSSDNSIREIRRSLLTDKSRIDGQLQTLTMHVRNIYNTTSESSHNISTIAKQLNSSIDNIIHDARMNDMKIRFNQKALTTLDRNVQTNNEKILEMNESVGKKWVEQTIGCGGILIADAGILSYKFRQPYLNNEKCIWTIRANRRNRVMLQLLEDGFQNSSNSDFITVTEFTEDMTLITSSRLEHKNRAIHTFRGPLIFISFYSDSTNLGNGFTLKFQGQGNSTARDFLNAPRYSHFHMQNLNGQINYPEDRNALYQPNEMATFVINVNPPSTSVKIHIMSTDMEKEETCEYDSVNFYGSVKASYVLTKKYCDQHKSFKGEWLQSSDGTFIVVLRSDASTQFKGIQFSWETY